MNGGQELRAPRPALGCSAIDDHDDDDECAQTNQFSLLALYSTSFTNESLVIELWGVYPLHLTCR
jgi:hypothetical protein